MKGFRNAKSDNGRRISNEHADVVRAALGSNGLPYQFAASPRNPAVGNHPASADAFGWRTPAIAASLPALQSIYRPKGR